MSARAILRDLREILAKADESSETNSDDVVDTFRGILFGDICTDVLEELK